jgi:hypothetical protein
VRDYGDRRGYYGFRNAFLTRLRPSGHSLSRQRFKRSRETPIPGVAANRRGGRGRAKQRERFRLGRCADLDLRHRVFVDLITAVEVALVAETAADRERRAEGQSQRCSAMDFLNSRQNAERSYARKIAVVSDERRSVDSQRARGLDSVG